MTGLSLLFFVVYAWQVLQEPTGVWNSAAEITMDAIWGVFTVDYVICVTLAPHKWEYVKRHLFDLAVVVLPVIRPLRLLRVVAALNMLHRTSGMALRGRIATYVSGSVILLLLVGSLAVLHVERHVPGATITTFPQALWWSFVTITTVGYGDLSPITPIGRLIAVAMMLAGIALIGVVTATLGSWIIRSGSEEENRNQQVTHAQIEDVRVRLDRIERMLDSRESHGGGGTPRS